MTQPIDVQHLGDDAYGVVIDGVTHHVLMSQRLLDEFGITEPDEERFIAVATGFLLDRVEAGSLPDDLNLDAVAREDPDFPAEMRTRLAT